MVEEAGLEEAQDLFQYVDEDEYARIVQQRQEEGFVLDDGELFSTEILMGDSLVINYLFSTEILMGGSFVIKYV